MSCASLPLESTPLKQPLLEDTSSEQEHLLHHTSTGMPQNRTLEISHLEIYKIHLNNQNTLT